MSVATHEVIRIITDAIKKEEPVFSLNGPIRTTVVMEDGGFKQKPLEGNEELILSGIREGKRNAFILSFKPLDSRGYTAVEMDKPSVIEAVPNLERWLVSELLGEAATAIDMPWRDALVHFIRDFENRQKQETVNANQDNPNWGRF